MSTKANKGEELKPFIERIRTTAELVYLDKGLTKDKIIIQTSLMGVNEPMMVKILEKFIWPLGCTLEELRSARLGQPRGSRVLQLCTGEEGDAKHCLMCSKPGNDKDKCFRNPQFPK